MLRRIVLTAIVLAGSNAALAQDSDLEPPAENVFQQMVAWSPDGTRLLYSQFAGGEFTIDKWSLHVFEFERGHDQTLATGSLFATWSPDGAWIAYDQRASRSESVIMVSRPDGSEAHQITSGEFRDSAPAWSPDGKHLVYNSTRDENVDVFVMDVDGSNPRRVTEHPMKDYNPQWSCDGSTIVFYRESGDSKDQIFTMKPDGTGERQITDGTGLNFYPSFLPNGRIAYTLGDREAGNHLMTIGADGSEPEDVGLPSVSYARWSPDGSTIAFVAGRFPGTAIYLAGADGSNIRKVVN